VVVEHTDKFEVIVCKPMLFVGSGALLTGITNQCCLSNVDNTRCSKPVSQ
jgi:hypothetical protein